MKNTLLSLALLIILSPQLSAQLADADRAYLARAEGHKGAVASPAQIDASIAAYRKAIASDPSALESRWKLLRALRFKGAYATASSQTRKKVYDEARVAGEEAMTIVHRLSRTTTATPEKTMAASVRAIAGAPEVLYWDAVNWGEWALVYGKMAAVKKGAADRIRRQATIVHMIDPQIERGGGARVLGRLHDQTPRVPFVTGWASGAEAVRFLKLALAQDPKDKLTRVFLAEALVAADGKNKAEAKRTLAEVIREAPSPEFIVEEIAAQNDARALLASWK